MGFTNNIRLTRCCSLLMGLSLSVLLSWSSQTLAGAQAQCEVNKRLETVLQQTRKGYLADQTLYTGGFHFKQMDSVRESILMYLAMTNRLGHAAVLLDSEQGKKLSKYEAINDGYIRTLRPEPWEVPYGSSATEVIDYASRVLLELEPAYKHLQEYQAPFATHFYQAAFDLDLLTTPAEPVDWWLPSQDNEFKATGLKAVTRQAARNNDLLDWLQFTAASSALPYMQIWAITKAEQADSINNLAQHAWSKWQETGSYAWLAALSEVLLPSDALADKVLAEFSSLHSQVEACKATDAELVAYASMLLPVTRLSYGHDIDRLQWLVVQPNDRFVWEKRHAQGRYADLLLMKEGLQQRDAFVTALNPQLEQSKVVELSQGVSVAVQSEESSHAVSSGRFTSFMPVAELEKIAAHPDLRHDYRQQLNRMIFLRKWVADDYGNDAALIALAKTDPMIDADIQKILAENNRNQRRLLLLQLVMQSPAMTYWIDLDLYRPREFDERRLSGFDYINTMDSAWWCRSNTQQIAQRVIEDEIRPLGLLGSNPFTSGGWSGADFYQPGQKRAYHRGDDFLVTSKKLHKKVLNDYQKNHELIPFLQHPEWKMFESLPPAPVYFRQKLQELERAGVVDDQAGRELWGLVKRAARYTCRTFEPYRRDNHIELATEAAYQFAKRRQYAYDK